MEAFHKFDALRQGCIAQLGRKVASGICHTWQILKKYRKELRCMRMTSLRRQALKLAGHDSANLEVANAPLPAGRSEDDVVRSSAQPSQMKHP